MVQGPTHATSGAAAGLALATALPTTWGGATGTAETLVYAGLVAGAALLPDLDAPGSTISRAFGPLTGIAARSTAALCVTVVHTTGTRKDSRLTGAHRTATHTLWFALLAGALAWGIGGVAGTNGVIGMLAFFTGLAIRGLFPHWAGSHGVLIVTGLSVAIGVAAYATVPAVQTPLLPASAVTAGVLTHLAGDLLTRSGIPLTSPLIPRGGRRWWSWTLPAPLTIRTSGILDQLLLLICTGLVAWQLWLLVGPG